MHWALFNIHVICVKMHGLSFVMQSAVSVSSHPPCSHTFKRVVQSWAVQSLHFPAIVQSAGKKERGFAQRSICWCPRAFPLPGNSNMCTDMGGERRRIFVTCFQTEQHRVNATTVMVKYIFWASKLCKHMATHVWMRPLRSNHCISMAVLTSIRAWRAYSQRFESWTTFGICEKFWGQISFTPEQLYLECLFRSDLWPPDLGWYPNRLPQSQFPAVSKFTRVSLCFNVAQGKEGGRCILQTKHLPSWSSHMLADWQGWPAVHTCPWLSR